MGIVIAGDARERQIRLRKSTWMGLLKLSQRGRSRQSAEMHRTQLRSPARGLGRAGEDHKAKGAIKWKRIRRRPDAFLWEAAAAAHGAQPAAGLAI